MSTTKTAIRDYIEVGKASSFTDSFEDGEYSPKPTSETSSKPSENSDIEYLTERLFSEDHLALILQDPVISERFQHFLAQYRPQMAQSLRRYLGLQKAAAAMNYANALAENLWPGLEATAMNKSFESRLRAAHDELLNIALPGFITYSYTQLITEILVREITGQSIPIMNDLVEGLAEVYCLTNPNLPDNPIVYASEEFYRVTQYDQKGVIGTNCRFLQGKKTSRTSIERLIEALSEGKESCEVLLNYRRDGTPFLNLLLIAPLYDSDNHVCFFIGAQIDINGLLRDGAGLVSFSRLLAQDQLTARAGGRAVKTPTTTLVELGATLNDNERKLVSSGLPPDPSNMRWANTGLRPPRKMIGMQTDDDHSSRQMWPEPQLGPNGRLPGVFQKYMLVSPYPNLEIVFTSPSLQASCLINSSFLARVRAPRHVRHSIKSAFSQGHSFTARISWLRPLDEEVATPAIDSTPTPGDPANNEAGSYFETPSQQRSYLRREDWKSKPRWIHCTPLLGANGLPGLWMIVKLESDSITDALSELSFQHN